MTDPEGQTFTCVWDALEDGPEAAANMRLRSELMSALQQVITGWGLTQIEAARRLDMPSSRLSPLLRGRINQFSLDALVKLAVRAGLSVTLRIDPPTA